MNRKFLFLGILVIVSGFISLKSGSTNISWAQIFEFIFHTHAESDSAVTLSTIRWPRTISVFYVGSVLAVAGLVLQSVLRNPLADSYTLGLSGGSAVGAAVALQLALLPTFFWIPLFSNIGALLSVFAVLFLARQTLKYESRTLILVGVMASLFLGALSIFFISLLPIEKSQAAIGWLMGEFGSTRDDWAPLLMLLSAPLLGFMFYHSRKLDALSLGDVKTLSLGYSPKREKVTFIIISTTLTAFAISVSGLIGFVGLVSPHIVRRFLKTSINKYALPASFLTGGSLLLLADSLGRVILQDREIPAGSLSALIGAPVLIYMLLEKKNAQNE